MAAKVSKLKLRRSMKSLLSLEQIVGVSDSSQVYIHPNNDGIIFYCAGNRIVMYDMIAETQRRYLSSKNNRSFSCLDVSCDGIFIAAGEKVGPNTSVYIWRVKTGEIVAQLKGHKFGIQHVRFSPNNEYIVTIGVDQDRTLKLWDWRPESIGKKDVNAAEVIVSKRVAKPKLMNALSWSYDSKYIVTAGECIYKCWLIEEDTKGGKPHFTQSNAVLGPYNRDEFIATACGKTNCYGLTKKGILCMLVPPSSDKKKHPGKWNLEKFVNVKINDGYDMCIYENTLAIAGSSGCVRFFHAETLAHLGTLTYVNNEQKSNVPDCLSVSLMKNTLACIYSNKSLLLYDVSDMSNGKITQCFYNNNDNLQCSTIIDDPLNDVEKALVAVGSNNGFIRMWSYPRHSTSSIHSYLFNQIQCEYNVCVMCTTSTVLATGDNNGSLRLYSLPDYHLLSTIDAHSNEITCIDWFNHWIVTGSNDNIVKLFNISHPKSVELVATISNHKAGITDVLIMGRPSNHKTGATPRGTTPQIDDDKLGTMIISSSMDSALIFSEIRQSSPSKYHVKLLKQVAISKTIKSMYAHPTSKFLLYAGSNIMNIMSRGGKQLRTYDTLGDILIVTIDESGSFIACAYNDYYIRIFDWFTGNCISTVCGHSNNITSLQFTRNHRYLISVASNGCLIYWKLSKAITRAIQHRLLEIAIAIDTNDDDNNNNNDDDDDDVSHTTNNKKLSHSSSQEIINDLIAQPPSPPAKEPKSPMFVSRADKLQFTDGNLPNWARSTLNPPTISTPQIHDSSTMDSVDHASHTIEPPKSPTPVALNIQTSSSSGAWITRDDTKTPLKAPTFADLVENNDEVIISTDDDDDDAGNNVNEEASLVLEDVEESFFGNNTSDRELLSILGMPNTVDDSKTPIQSKKEVLIEQEEEIEEIIVVDDDNNNNSNSNTKLEEQLEEEKTNVINISTNIETLNHALDTLVNAYSTLSSTDRNDVDNAFKHIRNKINMVLHENEMTTVLETYSEKLLQIIKENK